MPRTPFTFRGLVVPVLTPFNNDSKRTLNLSLIPQYAEYLAKKKITGVLVNGTTGEGMSMSVTERKLIVEAWANAVKTTKQHLMVQVGGAPLPDVLELAKHAESIKADSLLCLPELYFKPTTSDQLAEYLKLVGAAAPNTPLLYYHIPMFTNVNVNMGQFLESLGKRIPNFVGIKFTSPNLEEGALALHADNKKYVIFLGNDQLICAATALGMDSVIATSINMFPELTLEILAEGKEGNSLRARELQDKLSRAVLAISKHGNWVETMKVAMTLLTNINVGPTRAPLKILSREVTATMAKELQTLGFQVTM
ncbi:N-acetylneuraminate lyase-like isoform X1 [Hylaeus volcanicus]|uniref:N-acetylneuraminate lyase-like isoform X1 n=2 Tax=Hylaeus volcanicus TaxID=313075 RepID=UPI0023B7BF16|nr:N-acetylneuraminate lyase-like isoform X1 [Hylaeus volcanicus]